MPRFRVQANQPQQAFQPIATPVNKFYRPELAPGTTPLDFAPLSKALEVAIQKKVTKEREEALQAGEAYYQNHPDFAGTLNKAVAEAKTPEAANEILKAEFAKLVQANDIPQAADPYFQIGYQRAAGRSLAGRYREIVASRYQEAVTVNGEDGLPGSQVSIENIFNEVFQEFRGHAVMASFYGEQAFLQSKEATDREFQNRVADGRAAEIEFQNINMLATDLSQRFTGVAISDPNDAPLRLAALQDFLDEEIIGNNVRRPARVVMQALELAAKTLPADEAQRLLDIAGSVEIPGKGGKKIRLEDDASTDGGIKLAELRLKTDRREDEELARELQGNRNEAIAAIEDFRNLYAQEFINAAESNESVNDVYTDFLESEYFASLDPDVADNVREEAIRLRDTSIQGQSERFDPQVLKDLQIKAADPNVDADVLYQEVLSHAEDLRIQDLRQLFSDIDNKRGSDRAISQNLVASSLISNINTIYGSDENLVVQKQEMLSNLSAALAGLEGDELTAKAQEISAGLIQRAQEEKTLVDNARQEVWHELMSEAQRGHVHTLDEVNTRSRGLLTDRQRITLTDATREAISKRDALIQETIRSYIPVAAEQATGDTLDPTQKYILSNLSAESQAALEDLYEQVAAESPTPESIPSRWYAARTQFIQDFVVNRVDPAFAELKTKSELLSQASDAVEKRQQLVDSFDDFTKFVTRGDYGSAVLEFPQLHNTNSQLGTKNSKRSMDLMSKVMAGDLRNEEVQHIVYDMVKTTLESGGDDKANRQSALDLITMFGIAPEDLLKDELTYAKTYTPERERNLNFFKNTFSDSVLKHTFPDPVTFKISDLTVHPYHTHFTVDVEARDEFIGSQQYLDLLEKFEISSEGDDDEDFQRSIYFIRRTLSGQQ